MRPLVLSSLASVAWLSSGVLGAYLVTHDETFVPDYTLHVTEQTISQACDDRLSATVNGMSPGPVIRLQSGEAHWIRHWHGLAQDMAEFSDGSPLATQYPIKAGTFFDYELQVPVTEAGTFFYHSHVGVQALTVMGAIIAEDCGAPPYEYDDERVLLWHEHFPQTDAVFEAGLQAVPLVFGGEVQAVMLNGQGVAINHTAGERGAGDRSCQLPVVEVEPGKTYRFRNIGATSLAHSIMKFEAHENSMEVISVDGGQYTQRAPVDRMQIGSGQRFDVLFTAKTDEELTALNKTDFYIQFETRDRPSVYQGYGIIRYVNTTAVPSAPLLSQPPASPIFNLPNATYDWLESTLVSLTPDNDFPTLEEVTRRIVIDTRQVTDPTTQQIIWQFNGLNWNEVVAYQTPLLIDIYLRGEAAMPNYTLALENGGWDPNTKAFAARTDEVLEIVFQNTGSSVNNNGGVDVHPLHLHGEHYYDVGSGNETYDPEAVEAARVAAGYTPVKRDTTMLYRYAAKTTAGIDAGWRAWRIRTMDAGVWMAHCHTLQHMIMGMQTVWVVGNASEIQKTPTDLSQGYFTFGGDVYGDADNPPVVLEQFDHNKSLCKQSCSR